MIDFLDFSSKILKCNFKKKIKIFLSKCKEIYGKLQIFPRLVEKP